MNDGYIVIDNFVNDEELAEIDSEIKELKPVRANEDRGVTANYTRVYLDDQFTMDRTQSRILSLMTRKLFNEDMYDKASKINDLSFHLYRKSNWHETQLTWYKHGGFYDWHFDCGQKSVWSGRLLNYILYMTDDFEGGETVMNFNPYEHYDSALDIIEELEEQVVVKPKRGRLIIMPSYILHKVKPTTSGGERITINGHIGMKDSR